MAPSQEKARKPLDQQGGLKNKPDDRAKSEDRNDPRKPRQPHFDESADRSQGSEPSSGR
jgi:hypothetical protein